RRSRPPSRRPGKQFTRSAVRAVIDTNIWLRALISPHATPAKVLEAYRAGRFTVVASLPLLEELEDVLCRPEITHKMLAHLFLIEIGNPQRPGRRRNQGKWTWAALGVEFKGIRRCLQHEPGRLY